MQTCTLAGYQTWQDEVGDGWTVYANWQHDRRSFTARTRTLHEEFWYEYGK
jgi:hypothetical protein